MRRTWNHPLNTHSRTGPVGPHKYTCTHTCKNINAQDLESLTLPNARTQNLETQTRTHSQAHRTRRPSPPSTHVRTRTGPFSSHENACTHSCTLTYTQDLEAQLHHLAVDGGPRSIAAEAELRQQRSLCARLEADLDSRNNTVWCICKRQLMPFFPGCAARLKPDLETRNITVIT
eukprot:1160939-Pelagomonas_calceolata.AAC.6